MSDECLCVTRGRFNPQPVCPYPNKCEYKMKKLEDLNLGTRIALSIVIVIAILLIVAAVGYWIGGWDVQP